MASDAMTVCNIPAELRERPQWVAYRGIPLENGTGKIPVDPSTGKNARADCPKTWGTFETALAAVKKWNLAGIGYEFSKDDPNAGIDLDSCVDPETGKIEPGAMRIVQRFRSYTERSRSGKGLHIIIRGKLPPGGNRKGKVELYDHGRFFVMTGDVLNGYGAIEDRQPELEAFHKEIFGEESKPEPKPASQPTLDMSDEAIIEMAKAATNGSKFSSLLSGDWQGAGYPSQSEADQALCNSLAFWTGRDAPRMDRIFRKSGLYRRKWDREDYSRATIQRAIDSTQEVYTPSAPEDPAAPKRFSHTDLGNAERFAALNRHRVRHCHPWDKTLVWDGKRWKPDSTAAVERFAKETARSILAEAAKCTDDDQRKALAKWAQKSESRSKIEAMLALAKSEPGIPVEPQDLDRDDWLFNCSSGTLDLRTGKLKPHDPADLITKLAPVKCDPSATCPTWEKVIERAMGGSTEKAAFIQRAIGYSMTGDDSEQCIFVWYGTGQNSKSTILDLCKTVLGDYAKQAEFSTFLMRKTETVRNDIADLRGARFVAAIEADSGQRLAESIIKQMTGGDTLKARFLFKEYFEFKPTFKIFLAANHKPVIRGTDHAIWRRIRLVPFTVTIPEDERDPRLKDKLAKELPGILNWMLVGCMDWQEKGLGMPEEVREATEAYRNEMDALGEFLRECCFVDRMCRARKQDLYAAYMEWCSDAGEEPISKKAFGMRMIELGFREDRDNKSRIWCGIGLIGKPHLEAVGGP